MNTRDAAGRGTFSIAVVLVAVIVGVVSFAAFMVLIAFADDLRRPEDGGEHALSKSAVGFAGLVTLLQDSGHQVRINRGPLGEIGEANEFVVLTPPAWHELKYDDFYSMWGQSLIILPKWDTRQSDENPEWVHNQGLLGATMIESILHDLADNVEIKRSVTSSSETLIHVDEKTQIPLGPIKGLQTISGSGINPILTDSAGNIVLGSIADYDDESVVAYVLADPDLLNTHGLASLDTARAGMKAMEIVAPEKMPIAFDMTLHGMERTRNILQLLFTPPFLAGVLCLVFAGILVAITAFAGNLRSRGAREIPLGKTTLVDNSARLISLAGRSGSIGDRYAAMIRRQAARTVGAPAGASEAQQTAILDSMHRGRGDIGDPTFSELSADIAKAAKSTAMLRAINRLYRWKQELGRERRRR